MKITIREVFHAYQRAEEGRRKIIDGGFANFEDQEMREEYKKAISAIARLANILGTCNNECEIPDEILESVACFLTPPLSQVPA